MAILVVIGLIAVVLLSRRPEPPPTTYRPDLAGVIAAVDSASVTLADGQTVDLGSAHSLGARGAGSVGDLFLAGTGADGPRYTAIRANGTADCPFSLSSNAWWERDILLENGLLLSVAPGGDVRLLSDGSEIANPPPILCIDAQGQVLSVQ